MSRNWPVGVLAAIGFAITSYLTASRLGATTALFCEPGGGCDIVQSSRYAVFLGLPTAAWGAAFFAVVGALALAGLTGRRWLVAFVLTVMGVSFSGYLTWLALTELRAACPWCLAVAAATVAIFAALVARRPAPARHRPWARPTRLAAVGAAVAVVTVVVSAAAFRADTGLTAASGQEALARHLAASGTVFYGAYW
ncbi:MAG: vitamin K epoxide reductase family protein [Candidatus Rokubacteria bacterium]|nr:vitamin K epoxide reductase family protein [Candidatus Rokubacteria bacterium]